MQIFVNKITGFKAFEDVEIYKNGKIFYNKTVPQGGFIIFNLPVGIYETLNNIKPLGRRVQFKGLPKLPKFDYQRKQPEKFNLTFGVNKNKATVNLLDHSIFFDNAFINVYPFFCTAFIIAHELGHYFYEGANDRLDEKEYIRKEIRCDIYALNYMLNRGFNISQVLQAMKVCLSESSQKRTDIILNLCKKIKTI